MQRLKEAILTRGKAINRDVLLVDSFLNHQVDVSLMQAVGEEFARHFAGGGFSRVLTVESSGIAPAAFTALYMGLPLVVLKKQTSRIMTGDLIQTTVRSFTKGTKYELTVKREFLPEGENVLLIDDFLASGAAAVGLAEIAAQAGCSVAGIGIVVEKTFQGGRQTLESKGLRVESLARIARFENNAPVFAD